MHHGPTIDNAVEMTTRDGVTLVADVYRPAGDGRWPTLLHRTPYDRTDPTLVSAIVADPLWLARQGFAVVVQDVRGRFGSGGELDFAHQEHDDGYDAVEWAAAQPWSDGAVGVYGSSYHAISAYQAVAAGPPHLRAALTMIGAADLAPTVRPGGTLELGFLTLYALAQSLHAVQRLDVDDAERAELTGRIVAALSAPATTVATLPLTGVDVLSDPRVAPFWADWLGHEPGDPYWDRPTVAADPARVRVPLLQVASYRDFMAPTMFALATALAEDPRHRLVAGPWAH
ncbi:CocE/NonD family hydrolase, partial [Pseudonocardia sp. KRD291]|uniref:CocE/NonD family hydrolase n=1 Tax=Pseudonocardia sp. KRD291 TaxID=2792007 RepID=UPI001C49CD45